MCGNLLDDLDGATRAEVLEKRFIRHPLVMAMENMEEEMKDMGKMEAMEEMEEYDL